MRPTGLASPVDKDRQDFIVYSGEWAMGRIYEAARWPRPHALVLVAVRGGSASPPGCTRTIMATLDEAKAQFEKRVAAMAGVGEAAGNAIAAGTPAKATKPAAARRWWWRWPSSKLIASR